MTNQDQGVWRVVINDEEQYSIWFVDRDPPAGWTIVGKEGSKEECLAYIEEVLDGHASQEPQDADGRCRGGVMTGAPGTQPEWASLVDLLRRRHEARPDVALFSVSGGCRG